MQVSSCTYRMLYILLFIFHSQAVLASQSACHGSKFTTACYRQKILDNYLNVWNGDLSLVNQTFSPQLNFHSDRFPSSTGVGSDPLIINTREQMASFIQRTRTGWQQYKFITYKSVGEENRIAARWRMEGVIGANFSIPTTLKPGDSVTYNGTDFLILNNCTGLLDEVDIAQDFVTLFHEFGLTGISV